MAKCIIWIRTSTSDQEVDTQRSDLVERAIKDGFTNEDDRIVIGEKGASAIKMDAKYREEVDELIKTIKEKNDVSTIYVWEVSRLARNKRAFVDMTDVIYENHIQFICKVPELKLLDDDGEVNQGAELTLELLITLAKQEMDIKKKRFSRGKKRLADEGKYNGGQIPYGYRVDPETKKIEIDEDGEAKIVHEIFDMYEAGYSQMGIAKELFARGVKGKSAKNKNFTISLVHQILTNEILTGKKQKSKCASYERQYPQIITEEQFNRCREIAKNNKYVAPKSTRVYYAMGLMKCTKCGSLFKSGGKKGQYRCRDAYDFYKTYNGYEGVPRCTNKMNISINIMDSLVWELAIDYETIFILNHAEKNLSEYEKAKTILKQKIEAIPSLLEEIEEKWQRVLEAYTDGMKKSKYEKKKEEKNNAINTINKKKAEYIEELNHYDALIAETKNSLKLDYDFSVDDNVERFIEKSDEVRKKVASITDDNERRRLVHKHIRLINIEKDHIFYKFKHYPNGKDVPVRKITVYSYMEKPRTFYFIPNDGKGGTMLEKLASAGQSYTNPITNRTYTAPEYAKFDYTYLNRIVDESKLRKRKIAKEAKEKKREEEVQKMINAGYMLLEDCATLSGRTKQSLYVSMKNGKFEGVKANNIWYVKKDSFMAYLNQCQERKAALFLKRLKSGYFNNDNY